MYNHINYMSHILYMCIIYIHRGIYKGQFQIILGFLKSWLHHQLRSITWSVRTSRDWSDIASEIQLPVTEPCFIYPFPIHDSVCLQSCLRDRSIPIYLLISPIFSCLSTGALVWTRNLGVIDGPIPLAYAFNIVALCL